MQSDKHRFFCRTLGHNCVSVCPTQLSVRSRDGLAWPKLSASIPWWKAAFTAATEVAANCCKMKSGLEGPQRLKAWDIPGRASNSA